MPFYLSYRYAVILKIYRGIISRILGSGALYVTEPACLLGSRHPLAICLDLPTMIAIHPTTLDILVPTKGQLIAFSEQTGLVSTLVVGNGSTLTALNGNSIRDEDGSEFTSVVALGNSASGDILVTTHARIWRVKADGSSISAFAGRNSSSNVKCLFGFPLSQTCLSSFDTGGVAALAIGSLSCTDLYSGDGGDARDACIFSPTAVTTSPAGDIVFVDQLTRIIRTIAAASGVIYTLFDGESGCSQNSQCSFTGLTFDAAGNLIVSDGTIGTHSLYVLLCSQPAAVACPAGYACPSGRPEPCADSTKFCPANSLAPIRPSARYAPTTPILTASGVSAFTQQVSVLYHSLPFRPLIPRVYSVEQEICPVGAFCMGGHRTDCPAGTLGAYFGASSPSACVACSVGQYSPLSGGAATRCSSCPSGTTTPGEVTGLSQCTYCPAGTTGPGGESKCSACSGTEYSLGGPTSCKPLPPGMKLLSWGAYASLVVQRASEGGTALGDSTYSFSDVKTSDPGVVVAIVIVCVAAIPVILLMVPRMRHTLRPLRMFDTFRYVNVNKMTVACLRQM